MRTSACAFSPAFYLAAGRTAKTALGSQRLLLLSLDRDESAPSPAAMRSHVLVQRQDDADLRCGAGRR
ncbi:MAG TPA: hypothetical protein DEP35_17720 [Deltaproteobacteria bacterium]|nr:hypothetical protein [Deltaproteobacteria bacterium]